MKILSWNEMYYIGYDEEIGALWTRHKGYAALLNDKEVLFHIEVLVKIEKIRKVTIRIKDYNEN